MKRACIFFALLLPAVAVAGQENGSTLVGRPTVEIFRVDEPPRLDGRQEERENDTNPLHAISKWR